MSIGPLRRREDPGSPKHVIARSGWEHVSPLRRLCVLLTISLAYVVDVAKCLAKRGGGQRMSRFADGRNQHQSSAPNRNAVPPVCPLFSF